MDKKKKLWIFFKVNKLRIVYVRTNENIYRITF